MPSEPLLQPCPNCATLLDVSEEEPFAQVHCPICGTSMRVRRQFNNYSLEEVLGSGGMGAVYKAIDVNLQRPVALKLLRKEYSADEEYIAKFETEARITASINHPHVVKVFSFGSDHGVFYIAMELVDKGSLDDLINLQKRVAEAQVLEVGTQIASGLQAAYLNGLIHRDVKPGNILFADAHTAKIVDFGLALLQAQEAEARGEVWGTPYYVAPEKLNKEPEDFRSDIYSLGGTLFHALAGRPPFEAETASLVALKHIKSKAVSLQAFAPHVSSATAYVINRMLHKEPDQRYQNYDELIEHLHYARTQLLDQSGRPGGGRQKVVLEGGSQEKIMAWATMGLIALVVLTGIFLFVFRKSIFKQETDEPVATAPAAGDQTDSARYDEARNYFAQGDFVNAEQILTELSGRELPQPLRNWVEFHRGLVLVASDRLEESQPIFRTVHRAADFSPEPQALPVVNFFVNTAPIMAAAGPVSQEIAASYDATGIEALSLFSYALKNWQLLKFDDSAALMEIFLANEPAAPNEWISEYRGLAEKYAHDLRGYLAVQKESAGAASPDAKRQVIEKIRQLRNELKMGGKMTEELARMQVALEREISEMEHSDSERHAAALARETSELSAAIRDFEREIKNLNFPGALAQAGRAQVTVPELREKHEALKKKADWLRAFRDRLLADLNTGGFTGSIPRKTGVATGKIIRASDEKIVLQAPYGSLDVPWSDLTPSAVAQLAGHFIVREQPDEWERRWLLGAFAIMAGLSREGRKLVLEASQEKDIYRDNLAVFFEVAGPESR